MQPRFEGVKKQLKNYSKLHFTPFRSLESECSNFKVRLTKPKSVEAFKDALDILVKERMKGESVFLDEVENDVETKE